MAGSPRTPGCGRLVDEHGDHALACPTGLLARRAKVVERAWVRIAREAVGPYGQVVPQQWLARRAWRTSKGTVGAWTSSSTGPRSVGALPCGANEPPTPSSQLGVLGCEVVRWNAEAARRAGNARAGGVNASAQAAKYADGAVRAANPRAAGRVATCRATSAMLPKPP